MSSGTRLPCSVLVGAAALVINAEAQRMAAHLAVMRAKQGGRSKAECTCTGVRGGLGGRRWRGRSGVFRPYRLPSSDLLTRYFHC